MILMMAYLVFLGIFIDKILTEIAPGQDPVNLFNGLLLYYLGIEFLIRFFMQSLPVLNIESYLHLPIQKSSILHYVAGKSIFSIANYLSWLVFIPFGLKVLQPEFGMGATLVWIISLILLIFTNNFLATYIKRQLVHKPQIVGLFALALIALLVMDKTGAFSLTQVSSRFFRSFLGQPIFAGIPVLTLTVAYWLNYNFLRARLYPEEVNHSKRKRRDQLGEIAYLKKIGITGELISLELRLLWRHKRTRSIFYMAPIFLLYGLLFYRDDSYSSSTFLVFVGIFMTGGMMLNYSNYCFGYESNYFDTILVHYSDFRQYLRVKYLMAVSIASICYVLTIPYVLMGTHILLINTAAFLYNIGFLSYALIFASTYATNRLNLNKSASFNYQGMSSTHWLSMLPAFLIPIILAWFFKYLGHPTLGYVFIGILGLVGILLHKTLLTLLTKQFMNRRYALAKGFRS